MLQQLRWKLTLCITVILLDALRLIVEDTLSTISLKFRLNLGRLDDTLAHLFLPLLELDRFAFIIKLVFETFLSESVSEFSNLLQLLDLLLHLPDRVLLILPASFALKDQLFDAPVQVDILAEGIQVVWAHFFDVHLNCSKWHSTKIRFFQCFLHSWISRVIFVKSEGRFVGLIQAKLELPSLLNGYVLLSVNGALLLDDLSSFDDFFVGIDVPAVEFEHSSLLEVTEL